MEISEVYMSQVAIDKVKARIMDEEGFSSRLYRCPKGFLTIGFGFNLDTTELPVSIAVSWLEFLLTKLETDLARYIPYWHDLDFVRQTVLIDMAYNLGIGGLLNFTETLNYVKQKDYAQAAVAMLDSQWACDVKDRAKRLAKMMETGEYA